MKNRKKTSISKRLLNSLVFLAILLVILTGTLVSVQYYYSQLNMYSERAFEYSRTAADFIDGDTVEKYVETGEKDDYYYTVLEFLNATQKEGDLKYYYVFVPYEDDLVYVWDATNVEGYCELGTHENYMSEKSKAATFEIFRQDPPEKISFQTDARYGHIASAYSPVFNSAGDPVAVAAVDLSIPNIRRAVLYYILIVVISIFGIIAVAMTLYYSQVERNIIKPIRTLRKSTAEMIKNLERDKKIDINIKTGDEIEELANAVVKMDGDLREYISELSAVTAEKERIGAELNVANRIQASMLPRIFPPFPDRKEFDLHAFMMPAKEVGGDFYDFFMTDKDHIALVMADVSGKGIPAALFMVISKVLIKTSVQAGLSPAEALSKVNSQLLDGNDTGMFVTVWLAVIDIRTGEGIAANAGHEHPALKKNGTGYEMVKYKHSPAISTIDGINFTEHEFRLEPGESVFVYTDGVTEATDSNLELFGEERLVEVLNRNSDAAPEDLLPAVKEAIDGFVGAEPQFDDITMLCFRYKGL